MSGHCEPWLRLLYDGPFLMRNRTDKVFKFLQNCSDVFVSVDRLNTFLSLELSSYQDQWRREHNWHPVHDRFPLATPLGKTQPVRTDKEPDDLDAVVGLAASPDGSTWSGRCVRYPTLLSIMRNSYTRWWLLFIITVIIIVAISRNVTKNYNSYPILLHVYDSH